MPPSTNSNSLSTNPLHFQYKTLFLVFFFVPYLYTSLHGQEGIYIGTGINQAYMGARHFNTPLKRFDQSQLSTQNRLGTMHYLWGINAAAGLVAKKYVLAVEFTGRTSRNKAKYVDLNGISNELDLSLRLNTYDLNVGYVFWQNQRLRLAGGLAMAMGVSKVIYRNGPPGTLGDLPFLLYEKRFLLAQDLFLQLMLFSPENKGITFMIKPYYQIHNFSGDYAEFNEFINPYTYWEDPNSLRSRFSNFGIKIQMVYYLPFLEAS